MPLRVQDATRFLKLVAVALFLSERYAAREDDAARKRTVSFRNGIGIMLICVGIGCTLYAHLVLDKTSS